MSDDLGSTNTCDGASCQVAFVMSVFFFTIHSTLAAHVLVAAVAAIVGGAVARSNLRLTVVAVTASSSFDYTSLIEVVFLRLFLGLWDWCWWRRFFLLHKRLAFVAFFSDFPALDKLVLRLFAAYDDLLWFSAFFADNDRSLWSWSVLSDDDRLGLWLSKVFGALAVTLYIIWTFPLWREGSLSLEAKLAHALWRWWRRRSHDFRVAFNHLEFAPGTRSVVVTLALNDSIAYITSGWVGRSLSPSVPNVYIVMFMLMLMLWSFAALVGAFAKLPLHVLVVVVMGMRVSRGGWRVVAAFSFYDNLLGVRLVMFILVG